MRRHVSIPHFRSLPWEPLLCLRYFVVPASAWALLSPAPGVEFLLDCEGGMQNNNRSEGDSFFFKV